MCKSNDCVNLQICVKFEYLTSPTYTLYLNVIVSFAFSLVLNKKAHIFFPNKTDYRSKVSEGKIPFKGRHCRLLIDVKEFIYLVEVKTSTVSSSLRNAKW